MAIETILPLTTIGVVVIFSLALSILLKRVGLNPVLGFIISGFLLGPFGFGFLQPTDELVVAFGEMGLFVLLFYLGIELSFKEFIKSGSTSVGLAVADMALLAALGFLVSTIMGFSLLFSIVIALMLLSTSSAIVGKFILDKGLIQSYSAKAALAILILQDFLGILLLVFVTSLSSSGSAIELSLTAVVFAITAFVVVERLSRIVEKWLTKNGFGSTEITLYALGVGLVVATLGSILGLATALGAYFAGFALSESDSGKKIKKQIEFLRDFFFLFFFVGFGATLFFDPVLGKTAFPSIQTLGFVFGFALVLVIGSIIAHATAFRFFGPFFGFGPKDSSQAAILLTPLGEFVVIIATAATPALAGTEAALLAPIAFLLILISLVSFQPLFNWREKHESFFSKLPTFKGIDLPKTVFSETQPHIVSHLKSIALNLFTVLCLGVITVLLYRAIPDLHVGLGSYPRVLTAAILFLFFASVPLYWAFKHAKYFLSEFNKQSRQKKKSLFIRTQ